jgi:hypothetical protein
MRCCMIAVSVGCVCVCAQAEWVAAVGDRVVVPSRFGEDTQFTVASITGVCVRDFYSPLESAIDVASIGPGHMRCVTWSTHTQHTAT